ncbi:hypothetical protein PC116_g16889 [Phytophthora cactorum]|nr:hypothetical protein PC116_g16889 [Phytophthora cactorum]
MMKSQVTRTVTNWIVRLDYPARHLHHISLSRLIAICSERDLAKRSLEKEPIGKHGGKTWMTRPSCFFQVIDRAKLHPNAKNLHRNLFLLCSF